MKETQEVKEVKEVQEVPSSPTESPVSPVSTPPSTPRPLFLRTNLLYWLAATPNFGIELKTGRSMSLLLNGGFSHWSWKGGQRLHRVWWLSPEYRHSFASGFFVGAEMHGGAFNFKIGNTGYQGNALGAGITAGYRMTVGPTLDLDFSLGAGYTRLSYDSYGIDNGVNVRKADRRTKNFVGPSQAAVSLIFKL